MKTVEPQFCPLRWRQHLVVKFFSARHPKAWCWIAIVSLCLANLQGALTPVGANDTPRSKANRSWSAVRRAPSETRWESVTLTTNRFTGRVIARTNVIVEL